MTPSHKTGLLSTTIVGSIRKGRTVHESEQLLNQQMEQPTVKFPFNICHLHIFPGIFQSPSTVNWT